MLETKAARRPEALQDKRAFPRHQVRNVGRIIFFDAPCFVQCVIRNISADGALVCMQLSVSLPREVVLWEEATGRCFGCSVKWRNDHMAGLHFTDLCGRAERGTLLERGFLPLTQQNPPSMH
jgi:PilZ domain